MMMMMMILNSVASSSFLEVDKVSENHDMFAYVITGFIYVCIDLFLGLAEVIFKIQ